MSAPIEIETVIIGGGQAGLAAGYHLARHNREFVILDAAARTGDSWRNRWDSLRLFTPAGYSCLPGMPFPARREAFATKDEMADYLADYAARYRLPIEHGVRVECLDHEGARFLVAADGRRWSARNVIVATGAHTTPRIPPFAAELDTSIVQLSSVDYRNPRQLPAGRLLVVGAGNSGAEIALDLATRSSDNGRQVFLAGRDVGYVPDVALRNWVYPLTRVAGGWGAKLVRRRLGGAADPLGRVRPGELAKAGIVRLGRVRGVRGGQPLLADGDTVEATAVVWCTGMQPDYSWIQLPLCDDSGSPLHRRGVTGVPGLYVLGLPYQSRITSHLVGGAGPDARDVVDHLLARSSAQVAAVTLYTRPGCPYCVVLRRGLRRHRVVFGEINIWRYPAAAAAVRAVAEGNETVPTVEVAGRWLVNPTPEQVNELVAAVPA